MQMIIGMRTQLLGQLRAAGFVRARGGSDIRDLNTNSENWAVVKAALCASAYPNILRLDQNSWQLRCQQNKKVRFHNSSVLPSEKHSTANALKTLPTAWTIYDDLTTVSGHFTSLAMARCCTVVTPACLSLFAGPSYLSQIDAIIEPDYDSQTNPFDSDSEAEDKQLSRFSTLLITDWIRLKMDSQLSEMILNLRIKWYSLFLRRIRAPAKPWLPEDEAVLSTIINILSSEDQSHNLLQPSGIGQRPRPMSQDDNRGQNAFTGVRKTLGKRVDSTPPSRNVSNPAQNGCLSSPLPLDDSCQNDSPASSPQILPDFSSGSVSPKPAPSTAIRYLAIVSSSQKNVQISQRNGVWLATASEEKVLSSAFQDSGKAILILFLQDTRFAEGYARISSPGTFFTNAQESKNLGWELDSRQPDNEITAYFSMEWIIKISRLIESPPRKPENAQTVWELVQEEGEKLLSEWSVGPIPPPLMPCPPNLSPTLCNPSPFFGNYNPIYSGMHPSPMFNPYLPPNSPMHPLLQRMQSPTTFGNPYTPPQQFPDPLPYPQMSGLPPTSHQSHSYNYLRQNKGMF